MEVLYWSKLPISTTYGDLERSNLITYKKKLNKHLTTAGSPSHLYKIGIDSPDPTKIPGLIYIRSKIDAYQYTTDVIRDYAVIGKDSELIILGRKENIMTNPTTTGWNNVIFPEYTEKRLKEFPYIKEAFLVGSLSNIILLIEIDKDELVRLDYNFSAIHVILEQYVKLINESANGVFEIKNYSILPESYKRNMISTNGKLYRRYYRV